MKLYKYRSLGEYTLDSIENNYIWLSSPDVFNDPFDCHLRDDYFVYSKETTENDGTGLLDSFNKNYYDKVIYPSYLENGIGCFCESKDEILMWSHYADNHCGICLEYDISVLKNEASSLFHKVNYTLDYPQINLSEFLEQGLENSMSYLYKALYTKYKVWEYEKEWRIILPHYNNKKLEYSPGFLSAIYLGCNITEKYRKLLINMFLGKAVRPQIFQCELSKYDFALKYSPIT